MCVCVCVCVCVCECVCVSVCECACVSVASPLSDTVFSTVFLRSIATSQNVITLETPLNFTKCSLHMRYATVGQSP